MNHSRFSRRAFCGATGIGLGFLPLLSTDRTARAATAPKRLIMICWPNGVRADQWWPDAAPGPDYSLAANTGVTTTNFSFANLKMIAPLEPHRSDVLLFQGLTIGNIEGAGHESLPVLFDVGGGNSLDWQVAQKIGADSPFKTLNLAVQKRDSRGHIFHNGQGVTLEQDPFKLFDTLFASGGLDPALFAKQGAAKKSVLDYVGKQLEGFGQRLGTEDRQRVQFHLDSVRAVEKRLTSQTTITPGARPASLPTAPFDVKNTTNFDKVTRAHMDLMVLALASDLTRVITLLLGDGDASNLLMSWLGSQFAPASTSGGLGNDNSHHSNAHSENDKHMSMQHWFVDQYAYLIAQLKATPDINGSKIFDGSIVYVINNMNTGGGHGTNNLPVFIAGGAGVLGTGRYLRMNTSLKSVHAAVAGALGAPIAGTTEYPGLRV